MNEKEMLQKRKAELEKELRDTNRQLEQIVLKDSIKDLRDVIKKVEKLSSEYPYETVDFPTDCDACEDVSLNLEDIESILNEFLDRLEYTEKIGQKR